MQIRWLIAKGMKSILNPPALRNCKIDKLAKIGTRSELTNVTVGKHSYVGHQSFIVNADIGKFCSMGERCCIGGATHPIQYVSTSPAFVKGLNGTKFKYSALVGIQTPRTTIENDVWLGTGVYIKAGCTIRTGAVIGMNSVVTKDIGSYEIWAGNPAHRIRDRFDEDVKKRLLESRWWDFDDDTLKECAQYFDDPLFFLKFINMENKNART